jgi:hypothetical protein
MHIRRAAFIPQHQLSPTSKHTHSTNALGAMEATIVTRRSYQATDLLGPDFTVPITDPKIHLSQPRTDSDRRAKKFLKSIPRISLRPVRSADSAPEVIRSKSRSNKTRNGSRQPQPESSNGFVPHQTNQLAPGDTCATTHESLQSNSAPQELNQDEVRTPKLRLLFWKKIKPQKVPHITESAIPQENAGTTATDTRIHPAIVITDANTYPVATETNHMDDCVTVLSPAPSIRSQATTASHDITAMSGALPANVALPVEWAPSLHSSSVQDQITPAPVASEPCSPVTKTPEAGQANEVTEDDSSQTKETETVNVDINSTKVYSPEKGYFVGKLYELPPPEILQLHWRQTIRPQLVRNLRAVIASLPQSMTTSETTIEPELIMCGVSFDGYSTVTLAPTIWIRCGSNKCRKAVQQAVTDLSVVQQIPVHVTLQPPRQASAGQAPEFLFRVTRPDLVDEILPVDPPGRSTRAAPVSSIPSYTQLPAENSLGIRVQSLVDNQRSACGLRVQLSSPKGARYTCTLGGLVLLDDAVVGLTTGHAIFDEPLATKAYNPNSTNPSSHDLRNNDTSYESRIKFPVPASLRAARFGSFYFPPRPESAHASSNNDNHDFALLQLHADRIEVARNTYRTSQGHQTIDTISRDLTARAVQVVCSSEDVKPGQLIDGDCVIIDKTGYWETRKIQLETPLGKSRS